ncbi:hypothetical protein HELRODRAFT_78428, partial [Helobdella robusta]|uniref:Peptidase S1 domain-containing protein n=1 Tax=Helobdella robusta TaxID=6412 RepID=T1G3B6_HELRO
IVNGDLASPGAWPWQAQLFYNGAFRCGASIVADRWLLTAAHCLLDALENVLSEGNLMVKVGTNLLADPNASSISVQRIINTPDFDNRAVTSDLALLKLETPITFNDFVQPICLPDFDYQYEDMEAFDVCVVTGFGRTDFC